MEIKLIQLLLILGFFAALVCYLKYLRTQLGDRLIVVALFGAAVFAIAFPGATTSVAVLVGVGRGTDLVFYVGGVCGLFALILLYSKLAKLQEIQTQLARHIAISEARIGAECGEGAGPAKNRS